ncbi:MAG: 16S rRNA (uracil(1498)-N(3))-methyltransferase [Bacteroidia bacterium]
MHVFLFSPPGDNNRVQLDENENHHAIKVLRCKVGEEVKLLDGKGGIYQAKFTEISSKSSILEITSRSKQNALPYKLHLAVAPTKMIDRFEWFLEKATEIGVHEISPIITDRSERNVVKMSRMQKVVQAAIKQSMQAYFPIINEALPFKEFIKQRNAPNKFIAHCMDSPKQSLIQSVDIHSENIVLTGPEGDFTEKEVELALKNNYLPVTLGESRLRAETAAVVVSAQINAILQFKN